MKNLNYHFIIGTGRSGTTLLLSMLNSSSQIHALPETPIALYFYSKFKNKKKFSLADAHLWHSLNKKFRYIRKINFVETPLKNEIHSILDYKSFVIQSALCIEHPGKSNSDVKYLIDKNPSYTNCTHLLKNVFPEAKYVAMIRHPMAYVNSHLEKLNPASKAKPIEFHALTWNYFAEKISLLQQQFGDRLLLLSYEELSINPEDSLRKVCTHLNLPFEQEMLNFYTKDYNLTKQDSIELNEKEEQRKQNKYAPLHKPVNTDRLHSWGKNLSENEKNQIWNITKISAKKFDYTYSNFDPKIKLKKNLNYFKYRFLVSAYFKFAKHFYQLPIRIRELIRVKI